MFTSQTSELLAELALGGTTGGKAIDYSRTKAEILSCHEWPHPISGSLPTSPMEGGFAACAGLAVTRYCSSRPFMAARGSNAN